MTTTNRTTKNEAWMTVRIDRHPDFGGGTIEADMLDIPAHRAVYRDRIVRTFTQVIPLDPPHA